MAFAACCGLLIGGVALIGALFGGSGAVDSTLKSAPVGVVMLAGLAIPMVEAVVWTVIFVEGFAWMHGFAFVGALVGVAAYSVVYHRAAGVEAEGRDLMHR